MPEIDWHVIGSDQTTTFENRYVEGERHQRVLATASPISFEDVPVDWREAPIILLAPVFRDLDSALAGHLKTPRNLIGLGAQGWLRRLDSGAVRPGHVEPHPAWLSGDAVFVSEEDVEDAEAVAAWSQHVPNVILTRAGRGCTLWHDGRRRDFPAVDCAEVDPTGAGDVFATAFLVVLRETHDPFEAARFASAAAALAVSAPGLEGIGDRGQIDRLLHSQKAPSR
jgi:sugar/nucleoside kinase (ribokinase family)